MSHYFDIEQLQSDMLKFGHRDHLAKATGLQRSAIYQYLTGAVNPRMTSLLKICNALGTEPAKYFKPQEN